MSDTEAAPEQSAPRERELEHEQAQEVTRERLFRSVLSWRKQDSGRWRALRSR